MSRPLVYVDTSTVREGALPRLKRGIAELAAFVDANEPQLLSYSVFFSEDEREMTVVHVHETEDSLDYHLEVAGPRFAPFAELLTLTSIRIYGQPSDAALRRLREKARELGCGEVVVSPLHAGFARSPTIAPPVAK
jgi:hypothetical protein